eukprot:CAMPEP_0170921042 /NCGR_PEP_ID=MMETSP0735-20130129/9600_1 /TAXON_ID=186038 /ORGANISM="Fragilariopsis kerguelensis, Strain L26-C5" /LENGTH=106 /DNA_ID=CAMNT_0011320151 /DNA_START=487 /DNA_END=807 /DNA_ORIENTATION=-
MSFYRRVRRARVCHRRQTNDDDVPMEIRSQSPRGVRWITWIEDVHGIVWIDSIVRISHWNKDTEEQIKNVTSYIHDPPSIIAVEEKEQELLGELYCIILHDTLYYG